MAAPGIPAAAAGSWLLAEMASGPWFTIALGVAWHWAEAWWAW